MNLTDARDICHRSFQDKTLDAADRAVGECMARQAEQERVANVESEYRDASYALEGAAINLRAYVRGMVGRDVLPTYFKEARDALDRMEAVVSGGVL